MNRIRAFFPKYGNFFLFSKKGSRDLSPTSCALLLTTNKIKNMQLSLFITVKM